MKPMTVKELQEANRRLRELMSMTPEQRELIAKLLLADRQRSKA